MKSSFIKILFAILFLSVPKIIQAQDISLGFGLNIPYGSNTLTMGVGASAMAEGRFFDHYAAKLQSSFLYADFKSNPYISSDGYTMGSHELTFCYYPFADGILPYAGIGIGYYMPNSLAHGMAKPLNYNTDQYISGNTFKEAFGLNYLVGIRSSYSSLFGVSLEFKYVSSKHDWTAHYIGKSTFDKEMGKIDLSEFMGSIKFLVNF